MPAPTLDLTEQEIAQRLAAALETPDQTPLEEHPDLSKLVSGNPKSAAVLIPFLKLEGGWRLLFTRRNTDLPEHSGQVAFPGGRSDPGDTSPEGTALRESQEEIGLSPNEVRVLGRLRDFLTVTNYCVTPVVGVMPWPYQFKLATEEVSRVFTIPLEWLADPANYEVRDRSLPPPFMPIPVIYFRPFDGEVLWGASARFTLNLIRVLTNNKKPALSRPF